jgi:predicted HicB family RNase H-like nuclease
MTIRISKSLKDKLEQMANKDGRSLSNLIVYILDKAVNKK